MPTLQETQEDYKKVSGRELQIIQLMSDGQSTKEIACALGISSKTVDVHRHNIIKKTGCRNAIHVVATFLRSTVIA